MKFEKFSLPAILTGAVLLASILGVLAGQYGIDPYMGMRALPTALKATVVNGGATAATNGPIDDLNWIGDAKIDFLATTNAAVNTLTAQLLQSSDTTNWTQVTNLSVASLQTMNITNVLVLSGTTYLLGNTNFIVTNNVLYPFSIVTAGAGSPAPSGGVAGINSFSQGFSTPYPSENPFTNGNVTLNPGGWSEIAFHTQGLNRYLEVVYTGGGAGATNILVSGLVTVPTFNPQP